MTDATSSVLDLFPPDPAPLGGSDRSMTFVLDGDVDILLQPELDQALDAVRGSDVTEVIVDLENVTFMDCTGLRFLLCVQGMLRERGGTLRLVGISRAVQRLLVVTRTSSAFGLPKVVAEPA